MASAQDWARAQGAFRPEKAGNLTGLSTVADRTAQSGASLRTQKMADQVAKVAVDKPVDKELGRFWALGKNSQNRNRADSILSPTAD